VNGEIETPAALPAEEEKLSKECVEGYTAKRTGLAKSILIPPEIQMWTTSQFND
jgi:hypothetical protein